VCECACVCVCACVCMCVCKCVHVHTVSFLSEKPDSHGLTQMLEKYHESSLGECDLQYSKISCCEGLVRHSSRCFNTLVMRAGCVCVCVREREREKEREREREEERECEREREREKQRERERECAFMYAESEKVHTSERNETHANTARVHEDVAVRHEQILLHADACRQSAVGLTGSAAVCSSCPRSSTSSSRSRSARPCSRRRRPSLRRAAATPPSARTAGSRCSPTSSGSAAQSHLDLHLRAPHCPRRVRHLDDHRVHRHAHPRLVVVLTLNFEKPAFLGWRAF